MKIKKQIIIFIVLILILILFLSYYFCKNEVYFQDYITFFKLYDENKHNENSDENVIRHLTKVYKKSSNTITNGIQNAIIHAWRVSSIDDLEKYYTARVNYETGMPTPMEFLYYYADKIKKII